MAGPIRIAILANASQATQEIGGFGKSLKKAFGAAALAGAGIAVAKGFTAVVKSASDAQQSLGATETVFGDYADTVIKKSDQAAKAYGLSANSYRENANQIGSLLSNQGVAADQLAKSSDNLIRTGADLAATFGGPTKDAVDALGSAFKGEFDPLERYGISIKQSTVNTEAAALAHKKYGKSLDDLSVKQQTALKGQATQNLIAQQSAKSAGAFARETNTLAHQQQVLGAQFENIKAKIGTALLPILTKVFAFISTTALPAVTNFASGLADTLAPAFDAIKDAGAQAFAAIQPAIDFFTQNTEILKGAAIALLAVGAAVGVVAAAMFVLSVATSPITLVILAVAALGGAIAYAYKHSQTFRDAVAQVGAALQKFGGYITSTVIPAITKVASQVASNLKPVFDQLVATFNSQVRPALAKVADKLQEYAPVVGKVIAFVAQMYGKFIVLEATLVGKVLPILIRVAGFFAGNFISAVAAAIGIGASFISKAIEIGTAIVNAGKKAAQFVSAVKQKFGEALTYIGSIPGKVVSAIGDLGSLLYNAGLSIIQGLIDGVQDKVGDLTGLLNSVTDKIPDWKGPKAKDKRLLRPTGRWIMEGLNEGITQGAAETEKTLAKVTEGVEKFYDRQLKAENKALAKSYAQQQKNIKKKFKGKKEDNHLAAAQEEYEKAVKSAERANTKSRRAALKSLKDEYAALNVNAAAQDAVNEKLDDAREALKSLREESAQYAASVRDSVIAFGNITNLGKNEDGSVSYTALIDQMKDKVVASQRYTTLIQQLATQGLSQTALQQLIDAGVEGGLATAEALAAGGQTAIDEINTLTGQLALAGTQLGDSMANTMFGAGIQTAQGLVSGLESQSAALVAEALVLGDRLHLALENIAIVQAAENYRRMQEVGNQGALGLAAGLEANSKAMRKAAQALAKELITEVKKTLKIKSPSKVFKKIGDNVTEGLVVGLDEYRAAKAGAALADSVTQGFGEPALAATVASSSQSQFTITLTAEQVSAMQRGREIQMDIDAYRAAGGRVSA